MTKITTITLVALATIHGLILHPNACEMILLNGDLEREIYMSQTKGCVVLGQENKFCKL